MATRACLRSCCRLAAASPGQCEHTEENGRSRTTPGSHRKRLQSVSTDHVPAVAICLPEMCQRTVGRVLSKVSRLGETRRECEGEAGATWDAERSLSKASSICRWLFILDRKLDMFSNTSLMSAEQIGRNHRAVRERSRAGATSNAARGLHHGSRFHLTLP